MEARVHIEEVVGTRTDRDGGVVIENVPAEFAVMLLSERDRTLTLKTLLPTVMPELGTVHLKVLVDAGTDAEICRSTAPLRSK